MDNQSNGKQKTRNYIKCKGYYKRRSTFFPKGKLSRFESQSDTTDNSDLTLDNTTNQEVSSDIHSISNTKNVSRLLVRHHVDYLADIAVKTYSNELSTPGADGKDGNALILRPIKEVQSPTEKDTNNISYTGEYTITEGNIIVEKSSFLKLFNSFSKEHNYLPQLLNM